MKRQENISQELSRIAPFLAEVKKTTPYLEMAKNLAKVQQSVLQNVREEAIFTELKNIAPFLHLIEKPIQDLPFDFSALQQQVLAKIGSPAIQIKKPVSRSIFSRIENVFAVRFALPIAAIFTLAILTTTYISFEKDPLNLSQLSSTEIHSYLAENVDEVEEHLLMNENPNPLFRDGNMTTQHIEQYLNTEQTIELL